MPNHVTHKILFDASAADVIFSEVCPDGKFDFEKLVPSPPHIYRGDLNREDEEDFPLNWYSWNVQNWGTKWNCYNQFTGIADDGRAYIQFDTAWSIPYPILAAFCNRFNIPFEHRYFDEGHNFWGIEIWDKKRYPIQVDHVSRVKKRKNVPDDKRTLCIELKGYDPNEENDEGGK